MNNMQLFILIFSAAAIFLGQVIDWYSYHIKKDFLDSKSTEIMSVANWIQYAGRISNMIGVFLVSFGFEMGMSVYAIELMFLVALAFVSGSVAFSLKKSVFIAPAFFLQRVLCLRFFGIAGTVFYWSRLNNFTFSKLMVASFIVNVFLLAALVAPIFAASIAPEFRMTFAYLGQFLNFASSIIVFAYIDRILYKTNGTKTYENISSILWGKFLAILLMPFILLIYII